MGDGAWGPLGDISGRCERPRGSWSRLRAGTCGAQGELCFPGGGCRLNKAAIIRKVALDLSRVFRTFPKSLDGLPTGCGLFLDSPLLSLAFLSFLKKIYLFIFGRAGSSLLGGLFSSCGKRRLLSSCSSLASRCRAQALGHMGFSSCSSQALEHRLI